MLSNAYFLAKFRFDTAENEPAKNLKKFANNKKHQKNPQEVNRAIILGAYPGPFCPRSRRHRELAAPDRLRLDGLRRRGDLRLLRRREPARD